MFIKKRLGWEIRESAATTESVFFDRRRFMQGAALGGAVALAGCDAGADTQEAGAAADPSASLYPVERNTKYKLDRDLTPEEWAIKYNNYYEFGSSKRIADYAQALPIRPWALTIDGMVEKPLTIDIDDLLARMPLEERLYRHRCVEAWAMAVPWSGFPVRALVELAAPLSGATYVRFESFFNTDVAPDQKSSWYPWPYVEGLTIDEAVNDLAFMVTGMYGKPVPKQNGAPLRLALPWKYGFKSAKGIVKVTFTADRPVNFWQAIQGSEYGFWANVNPEVPHPRWSQSTERLLGTDETRPTLLYNGYGEFVADLYANMSGESLFM